MSRKLRMERGLSHPGSMRVRAFQSDRAIGTFMSAAPRVWSIMGLRRLTVGSIVAVNGCCYIAAEMVKSNVRGEE